MKKNETTARLLDLNELQIYVGLGRNKAIEWGKSIKADVHIGRRVLYDRTVFISSELTIIGGSHLRRNVCQCALLTCITGDL